MLTLRIPIFILTFLSALIGVYLTTKICITGRKIHPAALRARAFLKRSFLTESWKLLLIALILFLIHAFAGFEELFGMAIYQKFLLFDDITVLGIIICLNILLYKWIRFMDPPKICLEEKSRFRNLI